MPQGAVSVVIPTLQRPSTLPRLLSALAESRFVAEVIVINNAQRSLSDQSPKITVLDQDAMTAMRFLQVVGAGLHRHTARHLGHWGQQRQ
jgi:hypothetical protein